MLNQSFSAENFRIIVDIENRKGNYLEGRFFPRAKEYAEQICILNERLKLLNRVPEPGRDQLEIEKAREDKKKLQKEREQCLTSYLEDIAKCIETNRHQVKFAQVNKVSGKAIYAADKSPESYFALKQIQYNLRKIFKVKQSDRTQILNQLCPLLKHNFPKIVLRVDIKDFYESIPQSTLLDELRRSYILNPASKQVLAGILNSFCKQTGKSIGIPRGIAISAYLAEIYMRNIDTAIKAMPCVTYYARYVDDIIIVITPDDTASSWDTQAHYDRLQKILYDQFQLSINPLKSKPYSHSVPPAKHKLEYLGYEITFGNGALDVQISLRRLERIKRRISESIRIYLRDSYTQEKKARKLLVKRLKFLTGNTRLTNNKKHVLVGIYFINSAITNLARLDELDTFLSTQSQSRISSASLRSRIADLSFVKGFQERRFTPYSANEISEITEAWRNEKK